MTMGQNDHNSLELVPAFLYSFKLILFIMYHVSDYHNNCFCDLVSDKLIIIIKLPDTLVFDLI